MKIYSLCALAPVALFLMTSSSAANTWLKTGGVANTPMGHHQYCMRGGIHCGGQRATPPIKMSAARWSKVRSINTSINRRIQPATDMSTRGVKEYWEVARRKGDCEDYALLKRSKLMAAGYRASQLPLVKTRLPNGEAHIVLILRTTDGDFVLNNLNDKILPVNRVRMRFLSMQSSHNANIWVRVVGKKKRLN